MIRVNLLPVELRPIQRTPLPHIISLAVMALVIAFLVWAYMGQYAVLSGVNRQIAEHERQYEALRDIVAEHEDLTAQKEFLQKKIEAIQQILAGRTIWSEQLHRLTTLTPENIWYKQIRLATRSFQEEEVDINPRTGQPEIDPATGRPRMRSVRKDRLVLELSGYAVDDETGLQNTAPLTGNTTEDPDFAEMFELRDTEVGDTEFDSFPVRSFKFEYLIKDKSS